MQPSVDIRDFFEPGGSERVLNLLKKYSTGPNVNHDLLISLLSLARAVAKTESNKSNALNCLCDLNSRSQILLFYYWIIVVSFN